MNTLHSPQAVEWVTIHRVMIQASWPAFLPGKNLGAVLCQEGKADMPRWSDPTKWEDVQFTTLAPMAKLLLLYMQDKADRAGFLAIDLPTWAKELGVKPRALEGPWKALAWAFHEAEGWLWLKGHLVEQRTFPLNPANRAHCGIIHLFDQQAGAFPGLLEAVMAGKQEGWQPQMMLMELDPPAKSRNVMLQGPSKGLARAFQGPSIYLSSNRDGKGGSVRGEKGPAPSTRFKQPTVDQVQAYAAEKGWQEFDGQAFVDHFDAVGWVVGKTHKPMKSWKAAMSTWNRNTHKWAAEKKKAPTEKQGASGIKFKGTGS